MSEDNGGFNGEMPEDEEIGEDDGWESEEGDMEGEGTWMPEDEGTGEDIWEPEDGGSSEESDRDGSLAGDRLWADYEDEEPSDGAPSEKPKEKKRLFR